MQQKTKKWLSLVLAVLLVSACFTGTLLVRAAQDVAIDESHFPDAGFRQIVAEKCDKNGNGILSDSECSSITRMMLPAWQEDVLGEGTPIVSLEGIQYFYNLQNLYCADIGLTSLDVSALSKLTQLTCMDNALGTLDLSKNTALTQINCAADQLTELKLPAGVQRLLCENNALTALDLSGCTALTYLKCANNQLATLNLGANTALSTLIVSNNHLPSLDLRANTALAAVTLGQQTITVNATQQDNVFYAPVDGLAADGVVYQDTEKYENGNFVTADYALMQNGFTYEYATGSDLAGALTVDVTVVKDFYQVRFYGDETKNVLLSAVAVNSGQTAVAPTDFALPQCKALAGWSDTLENITADKEVYALYTDDHHYAVTAFSTDGVATISCTGGCGVDTRTVTFLDCLNAKTGSDRYEQLLDVNGDGIINARDYVLLDRQFNAAK